LRQNLANILDSAKVFFAKTRKQHASTMAGTSERRLRQNLVEV
jgi:hypothetical protein